jgi:hypothetical protein
MALAPAAMFGNSREAGQPGSKCGRVPDHLIQSTRGSLEYPALDLVHCKNDSVPGIRISSRRKWQSSSRLNKQHSRLSKLVIASYIQGNCLPALACSIIACTAAFAP